MSLIPIYRLFIVSLIYALMQKWYPEWTAPLSNIVIYLHEAGHAIGSILTGGTAGTVYLPECDCQIACARGGNTAFTLFGGYTASLLMAWLYFTIGRIGRDYFLYATALTLFFMFSHTKDLALSGEINWAMTLIHTLLWLGLYRFGRDWIATLFLFIGFLNLLYVFQDLRDTTHIMADINRYERVFRWPYMTTAVWRTLWQLLTGGVLLYCLNALYNIKAKPGERLFANWDLDKVILFIEVAPMFLALGVWQIGQHLSDIIDQLFGIKLRKP